ncbi:cytosolic iron-sulfur protein assembly protein 1, putative [Plasmodium ovale]|uniref:Probable cytosolic iron-sulfur protein assembly protein CIAO1 homolog n=1 Tax=Plasmodium ovale TaxID=36330 RepID=A0A1C3KWT5_PLAOA|nr:cytosolic iron-sulfur protein assembly protein 1, putative [Plasmodium ovale]
MTIELVINLENHKRRIWSICWSPDGNFLASVGADKYITIWHKTNNEQKKKGNIGKGSMIKFAASGEKNQRKGNIAFAIYDIIETNHEKSLRHIEFSKDGSFFVVASFDSKCTVFRKNKQDKWTFYKTLEGHEKEVKCAAIHPTNKYIVTCGRDKSIWIYGKMDVIEKEDKTLTDVNNIADSNNNLPTNGNENKHIPIYKDTNNIYPPLITHQLNNPINVPNKNNYLDFNFDAYLTAHTEDIKFVSWCPLSENTFISLSYDNSLKFWSRRMDEWSCIQTMKGHTSVVWCVSFNFDGSEFATCSDDKTIIIWTSEKKHLYNKQKYPFLYQQIVKDVSRSSNCSSLGFEMEKTNSTRGEKDSCDEKRKDINGEGVEKVENAGNAEIAGDAENGNRKPNFTFLECPQNKQEMQTVLNTFFQTKFASLYFQHGLFKYVYKYSQAKEHPNKVLNDEREESKGIPWVKNELITPNEAVSITEISRNDIHEKEENSKNEDDQTNMNIAHTLKENNTDKLKKLTEINITSKQNIPSPDEHQTNTQLLEKPVSTTTIQHIKEEIYDLKDVVFDDWKIKHVIQGYHKRSISYLDWNAYEDLIAASSFDNSLKIFQKNKCNWDLAENVENAHLSDVNCVVWCPQKYQDFFLLATAGDDCVINIWKYTK